MSWPRDRNWKNEICILNRLCTFVCLCGGMLCLCVCLFVFSERISFVYLDITLGSEYLYCGDCIFTVKAKTVFTIEPAGIQAHAWSAHTIPSPPLPFNKKNIGKGHQNDNLIIAVISLW